MGFGSVGAGGGGGSEASKRTVGPASQVSASVKWGAGETAGGASRGLEPVDLDQVARAAAERRGRMPSLEFGLETSVLLAN